MTTHPDLFAALAAPFRDGEVKILPKGKGIQYVTARTVMNRLDEVLGPERWWDDYTPGAESVICRLTIVLPDGQQLTKVDAGGYAGMADSGDDDKSGFSDAFKRAAVKFGVARYLYKDGVPRFVQERAPAAKVPPPRPNGDGASAGRQGINGTFPARDGNGNGHGHDDGPPRSGKRLFAWVKEAEERHQIGLLKWLNGWAKLQDFPGRMVDWDAEQVALAHGEAIRKIQSIKAPAEGKSPPKDDGPAAAVDVGSATKVAKRFEGKLNEFVRKVNAAWIDKHTGPDGEIASWVKDLANPYQIVNHMLKAAGVELPKGGNYNERLKAASQLWIRDEDGTVAEWRRYVKGLAVEAEQEHAGTEEPAVASRGREPGEDG